MWRCAEIYGQSGESMIIFLSTYLAFNFLSLLRATRGMACSYVSMKMNAEIGTIYCLLPTTWP